MKKILVILGCVFSISLFSKEALIINNRPLAKVNDKVITLMDVVKKLDTEICLHDPSLYYNNQARFQFFNSSWQRALEELIEQELILNEFEEKKLFEVYEGDVRKEMMSRFGPNIRQQLDKIHLTLDEAKEMIEHEMIVQQMLWYKAYSKAMQSITPQSIKVAYQAFLQQFPPQNTWKYQILTIKGKDKKECLEKAHQLQQLCMSQSIKLTEAANQLNNETSTLKISTSKEMEVEDKNLSEKYKSILTTLQEGALSYPIDQTKKPEEAVIKVFQLISHDKQQAQSFEEMTEKLKDMLMQQAAKQYKKRYIDSLKAKNHLTDEQIKETLPAQYQPFGIE